MSKIKQYEQQQATIAVTDLYYLLKKVWQVGISTL